MKTERVAISFFVMHIISRAIRLVAGDEPKDFILLANSAVVTLLVFVVARRGYDTLASICFLINMNSRLYLYVVANYLGPTETTLISNGSLIMFSAVFVLVAGHLLGKRWVLIVSIPSALVTLMVHSMYSQTNQTSHLTGNINSIIFYISASFFIYRFCWFHDERAARGSETMLQAAANITTGTVTRFRKRKNHYVVKIETTEGEKIAKISLPDFDKFSLDAGDLISVRYTAADNSATIIEPGEI